MNTKLILGLMLIALAVVVGVLWYQASRPAPRPALTDYHRVLEIMGKGETVGKGYTAQEFHTLQQYALHHPTAHVRYAAISAFLFVKDERQRKEALQILHSIKNTTQDTHVIHGCVIVIGQLGDKTDGDQIAPFLKHPDWKIREATVEALARIGAPQHRQLIESLARTEQVPQVREAIHKALQEWNQKTSHDRKTGGTK